MDREGLKEILFQDEKSKKIRCGEKWIKTYQEQYFNEIEKYSFNNGFNFLSFKHKLYHYLHDVRYTPQCICGNLPVFLSAYKGYGKYCSKRCQLQSLQLDEHKDKAKESLLSKYGTTSVFKITEVKEKIKNTKLERYGESGYNNSNKRVETLKHKYSDKNELKKFLTKQKATNLEKYGYEYANRNCDIKKKNLDATKKTLKEKYGVENPFQIPHIVEKIQNKNYKTFIEKYNDINFVSYDTVTKQHNIMCEKCNQTYLIDYNLFFSRYIQDITICTNCNSVGVSESGREIELKEFIQSLYKGPILENKRDIIGSEIDIFLPELNLGIEFNGLYWHSELYKSRNYHLNKTLQCEKKGIRLIQIFEDEWDYKKDIVKSRIKNIIGLVEKNIYARKCEVRIINTKEKQEFLKLNHIQGAVKSTINLGLYHRDELVSVMCFLQSKNETNLVRFSSMKDMVVVGGASKLLKYFIKNFNPTSIISFSDNRWSGGDLYKKIGFHFEYEIPPNYWYVVGNKRLHKSNFRKNTTLKNEDQNKTEREIMASKNILRIYDCGLKKWRLNL